MGGYSYLISKRERTKEPEMTKTWSAADERTFARVEAIATPWKANFPGRDRWVVTLPSGRLVVICCPLGAAVEIEEAGYQIVADRWA
jgi:hypothetical protein